MFALRFGDGPRRKAIAFLVGMTILGGLAVTVAMAELAAGADEDASPLPPYLTPELRAAIEDAAARQAREAQERETPQARQAREASATEYRSQTAVEALDTVRAAHPEVVEQPAWRPFTPEEAAAVERYYQDDLQARVDIPGAAADAFVQSTLPLRGETDSGGEAPSDLSLTEAGDDYEPKTPLVETTIPDELAEEVTLDDSGIGFAPAGAEAAADVRVEDDTAFYANVAQDSDFLVRPEASGAHAFWQLRSADSPQSLALDFELPVGANLERGGDFHGARIVKDREELGEVSAPVAWDAEGWPVDLSFEVNAQEMTIEVPHRDQDLAYPILVDPTVVESQPNLDAEHTGWYQVLYSPSGKITNSSGNGFLWTTGATAPANTYHSLEHGGWAFNAPGPEAYVFSVAFSTVIASQHKSLVHQGVNAPSGDDLGTTDHPSYPNSPVHTSDPLWMDIKHCLGTSIYCLGGNVPGGRVLETIWSTSASEHTAPFQLRTAGATVWIHDATVPSVRFAADTPEWVDDELTVVAEGRDRGLGVKAFSLELDSGSERIRTHECAGDRFDRCPNGDSYYRSDEEPVSGDSFTYGTSDLPEGEHTLTAKAKDFADNWSQPENLEVNVDHSGPTLAVSGSLKEAAGEGEPLTAGSYDVSAHAADDLSGVTKLELLVDDEPVESVEQPCPEGGCELDLTASIDTEDYAPGAQDFSVAATNAGGFANAEELNVTIAGPPATPGTQHLPCTDESESVNFATYSLGPGLDGLEASSTTRRCDDPQTGEPIRANYVSHTYGICPALEPTESPTPEDACAPPLEIQTWPSCERSIAEYELEPGVGYPVDNVGELEEGGAFAYFLDGGTRAEIYTGTSTVVIMGDDPAVVEAAVDAVQREPDTEPPGPPTAPPGAGDELDPPADGAMEGLLSCDGGIDETADPPPLAPYILAAPPPAGYPQAGEGCEDPATAPVGVVFHDSQHAASELAEAGFEAVAGEPEQALRSDTGEDPACLSEGADLAEEEPGAPETREAVSVWEPEEPTDPQLPLPPEVATTKAQEMTGCGWALEGAAGEGSAFDEARREIAEAMDAEHRVSTVYWGNTRSIQGLDGCLGGSPAPSVVSEASDGAVAAVGYPEHWLGDPEPPPEPTCEGEPATVSSTAGDGVNEILVAPGDVVVAGQDDTVVGAEPEDLVCQVPESELPPAEPVGRIQSPTDADVEPLPAGAPSGQGVLETLPTVQGSANPLSKPFGYHDTFEGVTGAQRVITSHSGGADFVRVPVVGCPRGFSFEPQNGWAPFQDVVAWAAALDVTMLLVPMWKRLCPEVASQNVAPPFTSHAGAWWRFVNNAVNRAIFLGADVMVEPWNEPNLRMFWCQDLRAWCNAREHWYADAYIWAYWGAAVSQAQWAGAGHPVNVPVMLAGPGRPRASCPGDGVEYVCVKTFLRRVKNKLYGRGQLGTVEMTGAHIYPKYQKLITREQSRKQTVEQFRLVREVFPEKWRDTFVTEVGIRSTGEKYTESRQCNRLLDIHDELLGRPHAAGLTVFKLVDVLEGQPGYQEVFSDMGTRTWDNASPKRAWTALRDRHNGANPSCG